MPKDKRIDAYIAKSPDFARPVMKKLRTLVHKACPGVQETIKWGMPSFEYKGPMFGFAAFKQHCVAGFWKSKLLDDPKGYLGDRAAQGGEAMGNLGRMTSVKDLPPDAVIVDFIRQAARLNEEGIKIARKPAAPKKPLVMPAYFKAALAKNKRAAMTFNEFSYSNKKEYLEWVAEAKTEATREKRIQTSMEWLAEGKSRHWKYKTSK
jgi:uncharacterized protein YdeI (YjbR/CyaY-like superfamily)